MDIEENLRITLEGLNLKDINIKAQSDNITNKYRNNLGGMGGILTTPAEVLTYAQVRMMPTFECVKRVVSGLNLNTCESLLDVGSGTGAGILALCNKHELSTISAIEKEPEMIKLSSFILNKVLEKRVQYINADVVDCDIETSYDIILASFVLNELSLSRQEKLVKKLWAKTNKYLILIDPGKPENFKQMMNIRQLLINDGAKLVAPCKTCKTCPLVEKGDWCHFLARVRRSSVHRQAKQGSLSYEDEKFTYLVFSRTDENIEMNSSRIIRRPQVGKGKITHTLCTQEGIKTRVFSKRDKELYKRAKDCGVGEEI